jgi:hypothetical protein
MSTPSDDNEFLHHLEFDVKTELTLAETGQPADGPHPDDHPAQAEVAASAAAHSHGSRVAARDHCLSPVRPVDRPTGAARYGRMFPDLDPLGTDPRLLMRAGDVGGICDAAAILDPLNDGRLDLAQVFDMPGHPPAQRAKRIDGRLAASLIGLPEQVTGAVDATAYHSLAVRDLLRGETTGLPGGEAVARLIGTIPLTADELGHAWPHGTPLWFYILKEAEHRGDGDRLGSVGGRIVAEVLIGLLRADPTSYLSLEPDWQPTLPAAGSSYRLADLIALGTRPGPSRPA